MGPRRQRMETTSETGHQDPEGKLTSQRCFMACTVACMLNGVVYAMPLFTGKLLDAGLDSSQVIIAGVLPQLGYGLVSIPFSRVYGTSKIGPAQLDRMVSGVSSVLCVASLALLTTLFATGDDDVHMGAAAPGFFGWGAGMGMTFFHSLSLCNFIFAGDNSARRRAVAFMMVALGLGSVLYTLAFHFFLTRFSLAANLGLILAASAALSIVRHKFMVRGRFEAIPTIELPSILPEAASSVLESVVPPTPSSSSPSPPSSSSPSSPSSSAPPEISQGASAARNSQAATPAPTQAGPRRPRACDYLSSRVVWLTAITSLFGFGVGATYFSAIGNLAISLSPGNAERVTFNLTIAFLCFIMLSRLGTTVIYAHLNWPYLMVVWHLVLFTGVVVFTANQNVSSAYVSAILIGLGFGGISSCPPVIAATNFPGGIADYAQNLSIAMTIASSGPFLVGYLQTVIYEVSSLAGFNDGRENLSTFLFFTAVSLFSTICALLLGLELDKERKLPSPSSTMPELADPATLQSHGDRDGEFVQQQELNTAEQPQLALQAV